MNEELVEAIQPMLWPVRTEMREAIGPLTAEIMVIHGQLDEFARRSALIDPREDLVQRAIRRRPPRFHEIDRRFEPLNMRCERVHSRFEGIVVRGRESRDEVRELPQHLPPQPCAGARWS